MQHKKQQRKNKPATFSLAYLTQVRLEWAHKKWPGISKTAIVDKGTNDILNKLESEGVKALYE